jgi:peptidyl-prolyl cis-trans isomerase SurA
MTAALRTGLSRALVLLLAFGTVWWSLVRDADAQVTGGIAAIVNDEVVSYRDLENRIDLFLLTANLENSAAVRQRVAPQILDTLIDETLKKQEAKRLNVTVSSDELDQAMADVGRQLGVSADGLAGYLRQRGVPVASLLEQIETEIAWIKTVNRLSRDLVTVSDEDVDAELEQRRLGGDQLEYRTAEIFLPVDDPTQDGRVHALADELMAQLRRGASFPALARIFSQGPASSLGGDLGWVRAGQLDPEIDKVITQIAPGQVAGPLRSRSGYHLVALIGKRASLPAGGGRTTISLRQLFVPLPQGATPTTVNASVQEMRTLTEGSASCDDFIGRARGNVIANSMDDVDPSRLPGPLQEIVQPLSPGEMTPPLPVADGVVIMMLCDRVQLSGDDEARQVISRFLREQRLAAASRRFLRDIRRDALIDIRLSPPGN